MKRITHRLFSTFFLTALLVLTIGVACYWYQIQPLLKNQATTTAVWWTLSLFGLMFVVLGGVLFSFLRFHRMSQERLFSIAYIDPLTGADNFNRMETHFQERVKALNGQAALVVLDICKFKVINEVHGSERGNEVLKQVARVLKENLQENESFCRAAADRFELLLSYQDRIEFLKRMMQLTSRLRRECSDESEGLIVDVALGIYEISDTEEPFYIMLDRAHFALENAKSASLRKYQFYEEESRTRMIAERKIESLMENALKNREFEVYLQPKCDFKTGRLRGAEALVRWNHEQDVVRPDDFIPVFEKNGFILQLDMFIFEEVARLLHTWQQKGLKPVPLAVNFSRLHLNDDRFIPQIRRIAAKYQVPNHLLEVELTENVIFQNLQRAQAILGNFHLYGFSVAMDDFGAGYSSLNVLKNLHFDSIKLDKEFLNGFDSNPYAQNVIEGTVKMIKKLGVQVVAEGVETREQADFLHRIGCDIAQGYFFSRPIKAETFEQMLSK